MRERLDEIRIHRFGIQILVASILVVNLMGGTTRAESSVVQIEKQVLKQIADEDLNRQPVDRRCHEPNRYRVYLIDNFEQDFNLVPEVLTSHGELLHKIMQAGRTDIDLSILNTSLSKGLATVIKDLASGACIDAVVSAIPGSNYTYEQVNTLFSGEVHIGPDNILYHSSALKGLLRRIAFQGFPSVAWLLKADVNTTKLKNDARKFAFIEAIGNYHVPVILPYGNRDSTYRGQIKSINLLSLAANAKTYSALDAQGERMHGFPYSPLSSGDETAVYDIVECPHPDNPFMADLDLNNDGHREYTFFRSGEIAYQDARGELAFAPPVLPQNRFAQLLDQIRQNPNCLPTGEIVLTSAQYQALLAVCPRSGPVPHKSYVWLNSYEYGRFFDFDPSCWSRGTLSGTSVIPPNILRKLLPPKT